MSGRMIPFRERMDREVIRDLVLRDKTCQQTGKVLDVDRCAVVRDKDHDPIIVLDPSCLDMESLVNRIHSAGWTIEKRD